MKKHYMLFTLLFTLLPFLNSYAEKNKALSISQASTNNVNGYRLQIPRNHFRRPLRWGHRPYRQIIHYFSLGEDGSIHEQR